MQALISRQNTLGPATAPPVEEGGTIVVCQNGQGLELHATLLSLGPLQVGFEIYSPPGVLRLSEVLSPFKILAQDTIIYAGRAIVTRLIELGSVVVCEAALEEDGMNVGGSAMLRDTEALRTAFERFLTEYGRTFRVHPEFKVVISDMQTLFLDLRLWMQHMELMVRSEPAGSRLRTERDVLSALEKSALPAAEPLLEKFETLANAVPLQSQAAHSAYMKRHIHPVVMCSPFLYRSFQKPLGYAGDYEVVNMMLRDPWEGASMFAKIVNRIFLNTPPVRAHQKRIAYLTAQLQAEARRCATIRHAIRVYNLGCGPAKEIQDFIADDPISSGSDFTLLDFNEETLAYTGATLTHINENRNRSASFRLANKSVQQLLKQAGKPSSAAKHDFVYCAGLFDYLPDKICKRLLTLLYDLTAPGGLLLATNVSTSNPSRSWMEYVLDWHLLYRGASQFAALAPDGVPPENVSIEAIGEGVNIALKIRKAGDES